MAKQQKMIHDGKRDWSDFPSELINLIAKKLTHLRDYMHVHYTCKSWQSSTPLSDFPLRFPWLLEYRQKPRDFISVPMTRLGLYSISSGETLTIPIKESSWIKGSSNNYLPLIDNRTCAISLFNPLTKDEFPVPLIHDPHRPYSSYIVGTELGPIRERRILIGNHGNDFSGADRWVIYDPHNGRWCREQEGCCFLCSYCQGLFFRNGYKTPKTLVYDLSMKLLYTIPPHKDDVIDHTYPLGERRHYIRFYKTYVVVSSGEIWRVNWYYQKTVPTKSIFKIYRLNFEGVGRQPCWVKISDIGDEIMFLEVAHGISVKATGFSITAEPANESIRGGCIYFIDPFNQKPYMYDLASGTEVTVPCPFEKCTWFNLFQGYAR